ncbi:Nucleoside-diphosphate-sugar epimerase [Amycolatopsis xylanica]|uniref:Nucleoside-diphosphate-sugar epimerase n=1 Tax=Amycolatopsis xylanica TaxID=589385 RepID=A0A1H3D646_9PSEU|nr:NAD-dependent epimerase/dehydratase family protein [Amycolatopsis xylanica]SDX61608.1 Nucleoside-diphosphate-sugar epimerase [Amycolatopsis xylanica]
MLVGVTGGTGFVGAHSVAAIVRSGHKVRLLAREESRVAKALGPLQVDAKAVDVVVGDVTDEKVVAAFVKPADAVLHAASVYSFDSRDREAMARTNVRGTEVVLEAARKRGTPVTHVSSVGALFPSLSATIGPWSPIGKPKETYLATKAAADEVARRHQDEGAPVVITYPPALLGPHDPHLGDQNARLRDVLRGLMPFWPSGGLPLGDVRDTALMHAEAVTAPGGSRVFGPSHFLTTRAYLETVRAVTGRALPTLFLPAKAMFPIGKTADFVQRGWPWHIPAEYGALYTCAVAVPADDGAPTAGIAPREFTDTVTDSVRWLHRTGRLTARQAGTAAHTQIRKAMA